MIVRIFIARSVLLFRCHGYISRFHLCARASVTLFLGDDSLDVLAILLLFQWDARQLKHLGICLIIDNFPAMYLVQAPLSTTSTPREVVVDPTPAMAPAAEGNLKILNIL